MLGQGNLNSGTNFSFNRDNSIFQVDKTLTNNWSRFFLFMCFFIRQFTAIIEYYKVSAKEASGISLHLITIGDLRNRNQIFTETENVTFTSIKTKIKIIIRLSTLSDNSAE